jgi:hypothetical protein
VLIFLGVSIAMNLEGRDRVRRALRETFAALDFATPQGVVSGAQVQVVKVYKQNMGRAYDDVFNIGTPHVHDSFWYCVAPGPCYFVAIPLLQAGRGRVSVQWVVRLLTEERMRAALQDDAKVLDKVFGSGDGRHPGA